MEAGAPAIDPAGFGQLLEMTGGDAEFLGELLDAFESDAERQLTELNAAAESGSAEAFVRPAHSLKGNSANVGAHRLVALARDLEADARAGNVPDAGPRLEAIAKELALAAAELQALRSGGS